MRINRETLLKITKDTVEKKFAHDLNITAVFLVGSLRPETATVDSAADVDLLVLHNGQIERDREIVKLSNDYHLDITYEAASLYAQPRDLRGDGWRGWAMWDPQLLYQKGRFFEYTQSVVRAQFEEPINIIKRSRFFAEPARTAWTGMQMDPESVSPLKILNTASDAANALACLVQEPLTERNILAGFPARAKALDQDDLIQKFFACVSQNFSVEKTREWLPLWEKAFQSASHSPADLRLHSVRLPYYKAAIETQLNSDLPGAALWPMLYTWSLIAENSSFTENEARDWEKVCSEVGLDREGQDARLHALDIYLDRMEEILEQLITDHGL